MKWRPREMKGFSKIIQLWLVAKQSLSHQWVFPFHHPETAQLPGPKTLQHFMENIWNYMTFPHFQIRSPSLMSKSLQLKKKLFRVKILKPNNVSLLALCLYIWTWNSQWGRITVELEMVQRVHLEGGHRTADQEDDWHLFRKLKAEQRIQMNCEEDR